MLTLYWRCEASFDWNGVTGADFSVGDNTPAAANGATLNAAAARLGTTGILIDGVSRQFNFSNVPAPITTPSAGAVAFWIRWPTSVPNAGQTFFYTRANASSNDHIFLGIGAGNDELTMVHRNSVNGVAPAVTTIGADMVAGQWYFVVGQWDAATNSRRVAVYDTTGALRGSPGLDTTTNFTANLPAALDHSQALRFGDNSGWGASTVGHIDNVFVGSAYDDGEVFVTNRDITTYADYDDGSGGGAALSGSGVLSAAPATISGTATRGIRDLPGDIELFAPAAVISGTASVNAPTNHITGSGALTAPSPTLSSAGRRGSVGSGALTAPAARIRGTNIIPTGTKRRRLGLGTGL